ncbi:MAG TPA: S8 family serine peptidase [Gaiellaceae bacterium]|jgi:serine protease AprX|nr:S8 family serine peptidase [Gaiellaceae bacterium]
MRRTSASRNLFGRTLALLIGVAAAALLTFSAPPSRAATTLTAFVPSSLLAQAQASPSEVFNVIVQGTPTTTPSGVASSVQTEVLVDPGNAYGVRRKLATVNGTAAQLTGKQLVKLASMAGITAITPDAPVALTAGLSNIQQWPFVSTVAQGWSSVTNGSLPQAPTIAVVDSGVDASRSDFGGRVTQQVTLTSGLGNSPGDGYGHGTFVAGIAAGSATQYTGAAPSAKIVSLDVMDDHGMALTSDVIAACDWIYANRAAYNIRVANFSLHSTAPASVFWDPLDRAVEKLWFSGVVVVTASGNYGVNGQPSGVLYAPGNDPFVLTVGADDISGSVSANDDAAAPWSSYGYTYDGFWKPEISAPGRYMVGPVPATSTLALTRSSSIVAPGYIQLSGTSFAAPVVAGAAAYLLALHPTWTPDQVKGALMLAAKATPNAVGFSTGVGIVNESASANVVNPPNPNLALNRFLVPDPTGGAMPVFDAAAWGSAARTDAAWGSAAWGSAAWGSAAWGSAAWGSAAWGSAAWGTAAWGTAAWGSSSLASAAWGSSSTATADNASSDVGATPVLDPIQEAVASAELGLTVLPDGSVATP